MKHCISRRRAQANATTANIAIDITTTTDFLGDAIEAEIIVSTDL
jgi:hypothetical protein